MAGMRGSWSMLALVVLVGTLAGAVVGQQCPFFPDGRSPQRQPTLGNCTHYIGSACCTRAEVSSVFAELPRLNAHKKKDTDECYNELNNLLCYFCSPVQVDFYRDGVPVMCKRMCDRVYRRCKRFSIDGVRMGEAYGSGTEFCEAQGFVVDPTPQGDIPRGVPVYTNCHIFIDAAVAATPSRLLLAILMVVIFAVFPSSAAENSKRSSSATTTHYSSTTRRRNRHGNSNSSGPSRHCTPRALAALTAAACATVVAVMACTVIPTALAQERVSDNDMVGWARSLGNELHAMRRNGTASHLLQNMVDDANYTVESVDAGERARLVAAQLSDFFKVKEELITDLAAAATQAYMQHKSAPQSVEAFPNADVPETLPTLQFDPDYKTNVSFSTSGVKIAIDEPQPSAAVDDDVAWTSRLDGDGIFTRNMKRDPSIRWQYVGTEHGVYRQFPVRRWDTNFVGFPVDFDPRFRPWYLATLSGPKDIVIVMDCSRSMRGDKWNDATAIAKFLVNSLGRDDRYNVVCFTKSHKDYNDNFIYRRTEVLSCRKHELLRGTTSNKEDTFTRLDNYVPAGGTDPLTGVQVGFRLLNGECNGLDTDCPTREPPRTDCQRILVFLSDGKDRDHDVRCGSGRYYYTRNGRQYDPPPLCRFKWDSTFDYVRQNAGDIRIFSFGMSTSRKPVSSSRDGDTLPGTIACDTGGTFTYVYQDRGLYHQMSDYYDYISTSTETGTMAWSSPYIDALGLGLLMTVSAPVTDADTGETVGVVGIDISLETIEDLLKEEEWGEVYSFLVDERGDTLLHPQLRPAADLNDDPVFPDIRELEQTYDTDQQQFVPTGFNAVRELFSDRNNGSVFVADAKRVIPQGDRQAGVTVYTEPTTYYVEPIPDSELLFGFAVPTKDADFEMPAPTPPSRSFFQHHMRMYNQEYRTALADSGLIITTANETNVTAPAHYAAKYSELDVTFTGDDPFYPSLFVSREHATFKLGPNSHCDVFRFINNINDPALFDDTERFVHTTDVNSTVFKDCPAGFFELGAVEDVRLIQPIEDAWLRGADAVGKTIIWKYVGTATGVSLFFPGHRLPHRYDPRTRPWYHQAYDLRNRGIPTVVTSPYLDISGSGKIVTIASTVFHSKANITQEACTTFHDCCEPDGDCRRSCYNEDGPCYGAEAGCTCSSDSVHAVAAIDVSYTAFHEMVLAMVPACAQSDTTRCFVVDTSGLLVFDNDINTAPTGSTRTYERISVARRDGSIMRHMVETGIFERKEHVDFQGTCSSTVPFDRVSVKGLKEGLPPRDADVYDKFRGPQPRHDFDYTCVKDVLTYGVNRNALDEGEVSSGSTSSNPCLASQDFKVTPIPDTNLFLVVTYNRQEETTAMPFNCHIFNRAVDSGSFQIVNGSCGAAETAEEPTLRQQELCPTVKDVELPCTFNAASLATVSPLLPLLAVAGAALFLLL